MSKVTDVEVSAFSECFLFLITFFVRELKVLEKLLKKKGNDCIFSCSNRRQIATCRLMDLFKPLETLILPKISCLTSGYFTLLCGLNFDTVSSVLFFYKCLFVIQTKQVLDFDVSIGKKI